MSADVEWATKVFASPLRVHLIAHYRENPGSQRSAQDALGISRNTASVNTQVLVDARVVLRDSSDDKRSHTLRVDDDRVRQLLEALRSFALDDSPPQ